MGAGKARARTRRQLFEQLGRRAKRVLILSEGFLTYLSPDEVCALAKDLAIPPSFQHWALDMMSPGLLKMLQKRIGSHLSEAGAPFKFGPPEGPEFFSPSMPDLLVDRIGELLPLVESPDKPDIPA